MRQRDANQKSKMKEYADQRRRATPSDINPGDIVLVKQPKHNKTTTPYDSSPYVVTGRKGTLVTAKRNEKEITRNSSHFKRIDDSHMTGVELDDESDDETVNVPIMPPMPSDHPPNITEPTPATTAVGNRHVPQTPPRPRAVPRAATSSSPRNVPNPTPARARPCRARTEPAWMRDFVRK